MEVGVPVVFIEADRGELFVELWAEMGLSCVYVFDDDIFFFAGGAFAVAVGAGDFWIFLVYLHLIVINS